MIKQKVLKMITLFHQNFFYVAKPSEKSNPLRDLNSKITDHFSWSPTCNAPVKKFTRKIIEVYFTRY